MDRKIYDELYRQNETLRQSNRTLENQLAQAERQTDLLKQQNRLLTEQLSEQTALLRSIHGSLSKLPDLLMTLAKQQN